MYRADLLHQFTRVGYSYCDFERQSPPVVVAAAVVVFGPFQQVGINAHAARSVQPLPQVDRSADRLAGKWPWRRATSGGSTVRPAAPAFARESRRISPLVLIVLHILTFYILFS